MRGLLQMIRLDNDLEFISLELDLWCKQMKSPWCILSQEIKLVHWKEDYIKHQPHSELSYKTPRPNLQ
jgi:hypothetical protein